MKVIILTEGTGATGYGHLTRCLSICQAFDEKKITPIFIANCDKRGNDILLGVNLVTFNWLAELNKLHNIIKAADILIIDSYLASNEVYLDLSQRVPKVIFIDDYQRINYPQGIILNGTIGAERLDYHNFAQDKMLLGVKYIPIRKEFWDVADKIHNETVRHILITLGGNDVRNISLTILDAVSKKYPNINYTVVLGSDINKNILPQHLVKKNIALQHSLSAASMLKLMLHSDIAISAAGQTLYELARVGVPTVAIGVAQNQSFNLRGWIESSFILDSLWYDDQEFNIKLGFLLEKTMNNNYRERIRKTIPLLVDGQGARRIVAQLN